jgi:CcmD family protein
MQNFGYLFAAYSIIFALLFFYVMFIWRRQAGLEAELRALEARLKELGQSSSAASANSSRAGQ